MAEKTTPAALADELLALRDQRLKLSRKIDDIRKEEATLKQRLIVALQRQDATQIAGRRARASLQRKIVPQVADWTKLYAYIKRHGAFELLQRRVAAIAVRERWDAGKKVGGVEPIELTDLSISALKR